MEDVVKGTDLVGTWRLVTWEAHREGGTLTHPFGPDAVGYIIYTADGFVSATLMRSMRQAFRGGTMHSGTVDEKVAAIGSYIAYAGTYSLQPGKVTHHLVASLLPNWVGTDFERYIEWTDGRLVLTSPVMTSPDGSMATQRLVWARVNSA
jgi:hypothetical protein